WVSNHVYTFAVDQRWAALEPCDVINLPLLGKLYRVRISKIDDANEVLRTITASSDNNLSYQSAATSHVADPGRVVRPIIVRGQSNLIMMDSALMRDVDDTGRVSAPLYSAVYPTSPGGTFSG